GNTLGELQTTILLERTDTGEAANGWDGDRYEVFEHDNGNLALSWYTTWDTDEDARQFARAIAAYYTNKLPALAAEASAEEASADASPEPDWQAAEGTLRHAVGEATLHVQWRSSDVVVSAGFDSATTDSVVSAL